MRGGAKGKAGRGYQSGFTFIPGFWPQGLGTGRAQEGHTQKKVAVHFPGGQAEGQYQESLAPYWRCYLGGWCCLERKAISAMTLTVLS